MGESTNELNGNGDFKAKRSHVHVWFFEARPTAERDVLTAAALESIHAHQYVAGTYTALDTFMNPFWTALTEYLPRWLAPNLVTVLGSLHCLASFIATWLYYNSNQSLIAPAWLLIFNAYCLAAAYTLDCMDGKQARRLQCSSPVGQLLDHGLDGICLLAHIWANLAWMQADATGITFQVVLQLSFYLAQWEEYYTGVLPHASGQVGVTEVNYGCALISLLHGTIWRKSAVYSTAAADDLQWLIKSGFVSRRFIDVILASLCPGTRYEDVLRGWQRKHVLVWMGCVSMSILIVLCLGRVWRHLKTNRHRLSALTQLATPLSIVVVALTHEQYYIASSSADLERSIFRWKSLAVGLLFCHVTIKLIVYSMAREAVAVMQVDVVPLIAAAIFTAFETRLTSLGHEVLWRVLSAFWGYRLLTWNAAAIQQICLRLGIYMWSVEKRKME
jgi:ethanolaminephosphotransferase